MLSSNRTPVKSASSFQQLEDIVLATMSSGGSCYVRRTGELRQMDPLKIEKELCRIWGSGIKKVTANGDDITVKMDTWTDGVEI